MISVTAMVQKLFHTENDFFLTIRTYVFVKHYAVHDDNYKSVNTIDNLIRSNYLVTRRNFIKVNILKLTK